MMAWSGASIFSSSFQFTGLNISFMALAATCWGAVGIPSFIAFRTSAGVCSVNMLSTILVIFFFPLRTGETGHEFLEILGLEFGGSQRPVYRDEAGRFLRIEPRKLANHGRSHAVASQDGFFHTRFFQDGIDRPCEQVHGVIDLWLVGFAVPWQLDQDHPDFAVERGNLIAPKVHVARPAVDEDQRRISLAQALVMHADVAEFGTLRRRLLHRNQI